MVADGLLWVPSLQQHRTIVQPPAEAGRRRRGLCVACECPGGAGSKRRTCRAAAAATRTTRRSSSCSTAMAHRFGRSHQRAQASSGPVPLPLSWTRGHGAMGRTRRDHERALGVGPIGSAFNACARPVRPGRAPPMPATAILTAVGNASSSSHQRVPLMVSRMTLMVRLYLQRDGDRNPAIQRFQSLHAQLQLAWRLLVLQRNGNCGDGCGLSEWADRT
jgi:hypothetical protein